jgi:hypothetical protein
MAWRTGSDMEAGCPVTTPWRQETAECYILQGNSEAERWETWREAMEITG